VNTNEAKVVAGIRQQGFQETDIVSVVRPITKYSVHITDAKKIPQELEKIYMYAISGRPGPTLMDIPIDVLRSEIDIQPIKNVVMESDVNHLKYDRYCELMINQLKIAKRPVIVAGNGINIANCRKDFLELVQKLQVPVVTSMISIDLLETNNKLNFGFIGAYGNRCANIITSASDLIISIGSRLDKRQTGTDVSAFAPNAQLIRIDIDDHELSNTIKKGETKIQANLSQLLRYFNNYSFNVSGNTDWIDKCHKIKDLLVGVDNLLPNEYVKDISKMLPVGVNVTTDVGQNQVWVAQSFDIKAGQRILFSGGHGAMGYSLPAAIGVFIATKKPVYCFAGDGGFQMNIQELQAIVDYKMPIKIFVMNNKSLGMIKQFQEMFFESNFAMTDAKQGYKSPDFVKIAKAYGLDGIRVSSLRGMDKLYSSISNSDPILVEIDLPNMTYVYPKLVFGRSAREQEPLLEKTLSDKITAIL